MIFLLVGLAGALALGNLAFVFSALLCEVGWCAWWVPLYG